MFFNFQMRSMAIKFAIYITKKLLFHIELNVDQFKTLSVPF